MGPSGDLTAARTVCRLRGAPVPGSSRRRSGDARLAPTPTGPAFGGGGRARSPGYAAPRSMRVNASRGDSLPLLIAPHWGPIRAPIELTWDVLRVEQRPLRASATEHTNRRRKRLPAKHRFSIL